MNNTSIRRKLNKGTPPQGGVLSPLIFNSIFDILLTELDNLSNVQSGYADEGCSICTGMDPTIVRDNLQRVTKVAECWAKDQGLTLCPDKTFVIVFSRRKIPDLRPITINDQNIRFEQFIKYLGVWP